MSTAKDVFAREAFASKDMKDRLAVSQLPRRARRSPWQYLWAALGILLVLIAIEFLLQPGWRWSVVLQYLFDGRVMQGLRNTVILTFASLIIGCVLGLLTCAARLSRYALLRVTAITYIWVIRALPIMVVLLLLFFLGAVVPVLEIGIIGLPPLHTVPTSDVITRFGAALAGLSIYFGAKAAEVFRAGYIAVNRGQHQAIHSLGISPRVAFVRVLMPQVVRVIMPTLSNEVATQFKNTSVVVVIGYAELLTTVQILYSSNGLTIPMLAVAWVWYLIITSALILVQMRLELKFGKGYERRKQ